MLAYEANRQGLLPAPAVAAEPDFAAACAASPFSTHQHVLAISAVLAIQVDSCRTIRLTQV